MLPVPFCDDLSILDDHGVWRRIPPWHFVFDGNLGRIRPSTAAFEDDGDGHPMSTVLEAVVMQDGRTPREIVDGHDGFGLAEFKAGVAREKGQGIQRDPLDNEPAHALVFGNKTNSVKKALVRDSTWIISPSAHAAAELKAKHGQ